MAGRAAFVTGATGMVGSHLARRLLDEGWHVRALARPGSDTALLREWGVDLVEGDVTDPAGTFTGPMEDAEAVFHCAALVSDWASLDEMVRVNVEGTRHLAEAAIACGTIRRFVFLSSMVVFGMDPQRDLDETAPVVRTHDHYNETKIQSELLVQKLARERSLPAVIIRPPYIYGPRDRQFLPRILSLLQSGQFKFIGSGDQPFTLCAVRNLVDLIMRAVETPGAEGEVFLATDGESTTRRRFIEIVCEEMGYEMPTQHVPVWLARLVRPLIEGIHALKRGEEPPLINRFKLKFMVTPMTFRIDKARRVLGYDPLIDTEAGLREALAWFRETVPELAPR